MAQRAPFPSNPEDFDADNRIAFSKETKSYLLEDENGEEWEWLAGPAKWSKTMDEALMKQQQEIYKVDGVDDDAPAFDPVKKRKAAQQEDVSFNGCNNSSREHGATNARQLDSNKKAKANNGATAKATASATAAPSANKPRQSTAVFVSGLPLDVDTEEVREVFSKYGIIAESADDNEKRVKLYNDANGNFKGEALIIFFRPESVRQAVMLADGMLWPRDFGQPTSTISVIEADSTYKKSNDDTVAPERQERGAPKAKPSKAKLKRKAEEMNQRLGEWSDDEISTMPQTSSRYDKVVVVKHAFRLEEFENQKPGEDVRQDIYDDMMEEGEKYGTVKHIEIFDLEEDGVVTVRFQNAEAASAFARAIDGRQFGGPTKIQASISTGDERFKKKRKTAEQKEAEEARRLEQYSKDIEGGAAAANGDEKA
ncbi:Splicing factor U2AF-associated protein 2 [Pseudocercospora fuligena]|uniref:Splicing factor U2AF-associated protein 2 n=1 Tax=Pseudocercospora fuligena TaxID=685502 RepID=A0A8H6VE92_9PEZI|nr:Splicing factor U2AF-associated protein 2 [Pseudocercospora fuligena]